MAQSGQLVQWNDDRGFGFIESADGRRHFVHISAIGRIATRPRIGDHVSFVPGIGADGRAQAKAVRIVGANPVELRQAGRPGLATVPAGLDWRLSGALAVLVLLLAGLMLDRLPWQVAMAYAGMSLVSLIAYRSDKIFAEAGHWRISEVTLQTLDLCLGIAGGLLGQSLFRHKTRKRAYIAVTMLILAVHLLWLAGLASGLIDAGAVIPQLSAMLTGAV